MNISANKVRPKIFALMVSLFALFTLTSAHSGKLLRFTRRAECGDDLFPARAFSRCLGDSHRREIFIYRYETVEPTPPDLSLIGASLSARCAISRVNNVDCTVAILLPVTLPPDSQMYRFIIFAGIVI